MRLEGLPGNVFGGFWARWVATIIDGLVINLITQPVAVGFSQLMLALTLRGSMTEGLAEALGTGFGVAFQLTLALIYFGVLQPYYGTTLGKRVFKLRLLGQDLQPVDWRVGLKRYAMLIVSSIPFYAGLIVAAWHPRKQGWHDRVARTVVVYPDRLNASLAPVETSENPAIERWAA